MISSTVSVGNTGVGVPRQQSSTIVGASGIGSRLLRYKDKDKEEKEEKEKEREDKAKLKAREEKENEEERDRGRRSRRENGKGKGRRREPKRNRRAKTKILEKKQNPAVARTTETHASRQIRRTPRNLNML